MHVDRRVLRVSRPLNGKMTSVANDCRLDLARVSRWEAMLGGPDGHLCVRRVTQLVETMLDVRLDRAFCDHQSLLDLTIAPQNPDRNSFYATESVLVELASVVKPGANRPTTEESTPGRRASASGLSSRTSSQGVARQLKTPERRRPVNHAE
jgi:hypothetical protein